MSPDCHMKVCHDVRHTILQEHDLRLHGVQLVELGEA